MQTSGSITSYPVAPRVDHVDDYHGTPVADPYRWMEQLDSPELQAWIDEQNAVTEAFLGQVSIRERLRARVGELWRYEKRSTPMRRGERYFYSIDDGTKEHPVFHSARSLEEEPTVLLDPNALSEDGSVVVSAMSLTEDGSLAAYGVSVGGSDWLEWRVREVTTGRDLDDLIERVKFSIPAWTHDNAGFYYSAYDERDPTKPNERHRLRYHTLGTSQAEDRLVYERPDLPQCIIEATITKDGRYLVISVRQDSSSKCALFYADLEAGDTEINELIGDFDALFEVLGNDGPVFWIRTDLDAPKGRVIAVDGSDPSAAPRELIPEAPEPLVDVRSVNYQFVAHYLKDVRTEIKVLALDGTFIRDLPLPAIGTAVLSGRHDDDEAFLSFTNPTAPDSIYRHDMATGEAALWFRPSIVAAADGYECSQIFYRSKDGTHIPMTICHRDGLELDGTNPTLLSGYGGFNVSVLPAFSPTALAWMELGGMYAVANIRGGGEYGKKWHEAATKTRRQTAYDDFIAAAEWLIAAGYTSSKRLAIAGGSNGGTLVGACMTQRPDLYGACLPAVGVMDMLRFHTATIGWAWADDYGTSEDPEEFEALYSYSPLHNLRPGTSYPPTLITTADCDDRVVPWHSFKFAAALQAAHAGDAPALIRVETRSGHGAVGATKQIDEAADKLSFLVRVLDMESDLED